MSLVACVRALAKALRKGRLIGSQFQFRQDATETMRLIFDRNTAEIGNRLATLLLTPMPAAVKDLLADHRPLRTITSKLRQVRELVDQTDSPSLKFALERLLNAPWLAAIWYCGQIARDDSVWSMTVGLTFAPTPPDIVQALVTASESVKKKEVKQTSRLRVDRRLAFVNGRPVPLNLTPERTDDALAFLREQLKEPGNWQSSRASGDASSGRSGSG